MSRRRSVMLPALACLLAGTLVRAGASGDWPMFGRDPARTGLSPARFPSATLGKRWATLPPRELFVYVEGTPYWSSPSAVTVEGETAEYAGRHFCPRCGSSVFSRLADEIEVHLGALDAPDQLTPTYECWTVRREGWLPAFPLNRRYPYDRDDSSRFE